MTTVLTVSLLNLRIRRKSKPFSPFYPQHMCALLTLRGHLIACDADSSDTDGLQTVTRVQRPCGWAVCSGTHGTVQGLGIPVQASAPQHAEPPAGWFLWGSLQSTWSAAGFPWHRGWSVQAGIHCWRLPADHWHVSDRPANTRGQTPVSLNMYKLLRKFSPSLIILKG